MEAAVAYVRVSSQRQVDEGGSLETQTKQVEQFARSSGYKLVRIFREEGESAKTDQRPQLQELLRFCTANRHQVRVVVVPKIDRLARNVFDYTKVKLQLNRIQIRLESLGERLEDTPTGRLTETLLASIAQFDNEIRAERSKGGMVEAAEAGRWLWHPPIGYRSCRLNGKGTIEPDPISGPVVREAFARLASGYHSTRGVREFMRTHGISRSESSFYRMLQNRVYIGEIHAFGRMFRAAPPFVALVDELTFYRAQAALARLKKPQHYQLESEDFPLRGTAMCSCARPYTACWSTGKRGTRYPYYRCVRCRRRNFRRHVVEKAFTSELMRYRGREGAWDRLRTILVSHYEETESGLKELSRGAAEHIRKLKALQDAVAMKNASGVISDELAKRQIERLDAEITAAVSDVPVHPTGRSTGELVMFAKRFFYDIASEWPALSLNLKKDLLRFMYPNGILFSPESGFRTLGNPVSEQVQRVISDVDLHLVDRGPEFAKTLHEWFEDLHAIVRKSNKSLVAGEELSADNLSKSTQGPVIC